MILQDPIVCKFLFNLFRLLCRPTCHFFLKYHCLIKQTGKKKEREKQEKRKSSPKMKSLDAKTNSPNLYLENCEDSMNIDHPLDLV